MKKFMGVVFFLSLISTFLILGYQYLDYKDITINDVINEIKGKKEQRDYEDNLKSQMWNHLFDRGYRDSDIYDLEMDVKSESFYVVFTNEKKVKYKYNLTNGQIIQTEIHSDDGNGKHKE